MCSRSVQRPETCKGSLPKQICLWVVMPQLAAQAAPSVLDVNPKPKPVGGHAAAGRAGGAERV